MASPQALSLSPLLLLLLLLSLSAHGSHADTSSGTSDGTEEWGYIDVRPGALLVSHLPSPPSPICIPLNS